MLMAIGACRGKSEDSASPVSAIFVVEVAGLERFRIKLVDPDRIAEAQGLIASKAQAPLVGTLAEGDGALTRPTPGTSSQRAFGSPRLGGRKPTPCQARSSRSSRPGYVISRSTHPGQPGSSSGRDEGRPRLLSSLVLDGARNRDSKAAARTRHGGGHYTDSSSVASGGCPARHQQLEEEGRGGIPRRHPASATQPPTSKSERAQSPDRSGSACSATSVRVPTCAKT